MGAAPLCILSTVAQREGQREMLRPKYTGNFGHLGDSGSGRFGVHPLTGDGVARYEVLICHV
jgi:hypothetical protein